MNKKRLVKIFLLTCLIIFGFFIFEFKSFATSYQITVNGQIPPTTNDYSISITSDQAGQTIPQGTLITYTVTYGGKNNNAFVTNTNIVVNYSDDSPDGGVTHVTDYVVGSATNAVNGTTPVIDPVNRTITWSIANFDPQLVNQIVQFQLITNSDYTTSNPVPINTTADLTNSYVTMPTATTTTTYLYNANVTPTPTYTPTPTSTPTLTPTPLPTATPTSAPGPTSVQPTATPVPATPTPTIITPTPTPVPSRKGILTVDVTNLQPTLTQLLIQTTQTDKLSVKYGTQLNNLVQSQTMQAHGQDVVTLQPLQPNTTYYIEITALDRNGKIINRDTFSVHTPSTANIPVISLSSLLLNADGISINKNIFNLTGADNNQTFILPTNNPYSIFFAFSYAKDLNLVEARIQPVGQINNGGNTVLAPTYTTRMYERSPNSYVASMASPLNPGLYDLAIKSMTSTGIITQQNVGSINVLQPLHVYDNDNITPLDDARVYIEFYDFTKHDYMPLQTLYPQIKNPLFTRSDGTVYFPFPAGQYRLIISAFGHEEKTIIFSIGINPQQRFPQVSLHQDYWNISYFFRFLKETTSDFLNTLSTEIFLIGSRQSYYFLLGIILIPLSLSFLAFFAKTHMTPRTLLHFLRRHGKKGLIYRLILQDEDNKPVSDAEIYLINSEDIVIFASKTNALGICYAQIPDFKNLSLRILKPGYEPIEEKLEHYEAQNQVLNITLSKKPQHQHTKLHLFMFLCKEAFGTLFEAFLLFSLLAEVLFAFQFGWLNTAPFLILSLLNIIFWVSYLQEKSSK